MFSLHISIFYTLEIGSKSDDLVVGQLVHNDRQGE